MRFCFGVMDVHDYARSFYKSRAWQLCRASYIAERQSVDGGLCERCRKALGYIVHHKVHITPANISNPDVTLNHDNLQYLCKACHDEVQFLDYPKDKQATTGIYGTGFIPPNRSKRYKKGNFRTVGFLYAAYYVFNQL